MFTNYRDEAATFAADLVNTVGSISKTDYMPDLETFRAFLAEHGFDHEEVSQGDLEEIRRLRRRLHDAFFAPGDDEVIGILNSLLARADARPEITAHDGAWHVHYVPEEAPLAKRLTAHAVMGLASLVADLGRERMGVCRADDCEDVFVDTSRNRSRRYCDDKCATRMNVAAYRARRAGSK
jgi:predicted RNA-binding Zn ribbon-like protein